MFEFSIAIDAREPLSPWFGPARVAERVAERRFELTSRGDRVCGRIWRPEPARREAPWLLAVHDLGSSAADPGLAAAARRFASAGAGFAAIDLPLHGERANAKLSRRAIAAAGTAAGGVGEPPAPSDLPLWLELARQAASDLARAVDVLETALESARIVSLGIGAGARIAAIHAALDARVRAAVWVGAREDGPAETRPARFAARISPRPLLCLPAPAGAELAALCGAADEVERLLADTFRG